MQARPADARRLWHEAAGEWPHPSLSRLLEARVATSADAIYMIDGASGQRYSFRDLHRRAAAMAAALLRIGVRPGDVVSWQLPNWIEGPALAVAIDRVGAVSNPIITMYREHEMRFICRQARSRVLVVPGRVRDVDHRELAEAVRNGAPDLEHVLTVRATPAQGMQALEALEAPGTVPPPAPVGPHDVSMLFYTSGTTADPKGVLHTPSTLGAVIRSLGELFHPTAEDRSLLQFPLPHIGGVLMFLMSPVIVGSSVVFLDQFDPRVSVDTIARYQISGVGGPPAALQAIMRAPNFSAETMRSVRTSGAGAADVPPELMRGLERACGALTYRSYGMTECPMVTSGRPSDPADKRHGTDGKPLGGCAVRTVDPSGRVCGPGEEGELEIFGPQLAVGYLEPRLNGVFTTDGFLQTGDLAVIDRDGYVRITGRRKDVIIRKGETLSVRDIEDVLAEHPQVAAVAVIGVPDSERGERVCACVVLQPDAKGLAVEAVRDYMVGRHVMRQKIPEQVEVMEALPRNAMGKVRKDELRARFRSGS